MLNLTVGLWIEVSERNYHRYQGAFETDLKPGAKIFVENCEVHIDPRSYLVKSIVTPVEIITNQDNLEFAAYQLLSPKFNQI